MTDMLSAPTSLQALVLVLLVFGVAPGLALRFMTLAFHRDDPRRDELRAELHVVPTLERPVWVAQQLETVIFDGLRDRIEWVLTGRLIHRWELGNGVDIQRQLGSGGVACSALRLLSKKLRVRVGLRTPLTSWHWCSSHGSVASDLNVPAGEPFPHLSQDSAL